MGDDSVKTTDKPWLFKPGNNANPYGRPKTGQAVAELFRNYLEEDDPEQKVPRIRALAVKLYAMAHEGNVAAGRALLEWGVPKPPQRVDLGTDRMAELAEAFDKLR